MGRRRGVRPESVRLELSDGDWIDVKKQLNAGEQRRIFARMVKTMNVGEKPSLDANHVGRSRVLEYLLGWSLVGLDDQPLPYRAEGAEAERGTAIDNLDFETYAEIVKAIDAHEEANEQARKNVTATAGETPSDKTSPSVAT